MTDGINIIESVKTLPVENEFEYSRRSELAHRVAQEFDNIGNTYRHKGVLETVAITDHGDKLSSDMFSPSIAKAMARIAESRGWVETKISGGRMFNEVVEKEQNEILHERQQNMPVPGDVQVKEREHAPIEPDLKPAQAEADANTTEQQANSIDAAEQAKAETAKEQARRQAIARSVSDQYRVNGEKYYFKDQLGNTNQLAFKDSGSKLSTALNAERVSKSLVDLAESKGWTEVKVSGHKEFRRQVWREASERGIQVSGYQPDEKDIERLALNNSIEPIKSAEQLKATEVTQETPRPTALESKSTDVSGVLVEHGPARYQHNPKNNHSHYVKIDTGNETRTIWGVELPEAISTSGVNPGDKIRLTKTDRTPVEVKDNDGKPIAGVRNTWTIERESKARVIEAVAGAAVAKQIRNESDRQRVTDAIKERINSHTGPLPDVMMYDNSATQTAAAEYAKQINKAPELFR